MFDLAVFMHSISNIITPYIPVVFIAVFFSFLMMYFFHRIDMIKKLFHLHSSDNLDVQGDVLSERRRGSRRYDYRRKFDRRIEERRKI